MKKALYIFLIMVLILVVSVALFLGMVAFKGIPTYNPPKVNFSVNATPELVEKGAKLSGMLCNHCHSGKGKLILTGRKVEDIDPAFGEVYSMNITNHPEKGIGKWSAAELAVFIRTGIRPDGTYAPPYMPKFPIMADDDMKAIIAFLKSDHPIVRPSEEEPPQTKPSFMTKVLSYLAFRPLPYPEEPVPLPDSTNQLEFGKYLATAQLGCFHCHSADFKTNNELEPEKSEGFFGGGNLLFDMQGNKVWSPNITMHPETGIGSWSEDQFVQALRYGRLPAGGVVNYPMLPYTTLSEKEAKAIYAYLKTVPAIDRKVVRRK